MRLFTLENLFDRNFSGANSSVFKRCQLDAFCNRYVNISLFSVQMYIYLLLKWLLNLSLWSLFKESHIKLTPLWFRWFFLIFYIKHDEGETLKHRCLTVSSVYFKSCWSLKHKPHSGPHLRGRGSRSQSGHLLLRCRATDSQQLLGLTEK